MKWVEKLFPNNEMYKFNVQPLYNLKIGSIICMCALTFVFFIQKQERSGYAVIQKIYASNKNTACINDSIFYEAKGILPIPKSNMMDKILFAVGEQRSFNTPVLLFVDFIAILFLLFFLNRFITKTIEYGPFDLKACKYLKWSVIVCLMTFLVKIIQMILMDYRFENTFEENYRLDSNVYVGQNWVYVMAAYGIVLNIFNYGRKLQDEVDLTV